MCGMLLAYWRGLQVLSFAVVPLAQACFGFFNPFPFPFVPAPSAGTSLPNYNRESRTDARLATKPWEELR
jgi:hypothetical protein